MWVSLEGGDFGRTRAVVHLEEEPVRNSRNSQRFATRPSQKNPIHIPVFYTLKIRKSSNVKPKSGYNRLGDGSDLKEATSAGVAPLCGSRNSQSETAEIRNVSSRFATRPSKGIPVQMPEV